MAAGQAKGLSEGKRAKLEKKRGKLEKKLSEVIALLYPPAGSEGSAAPEVKPGKAKKARKDSAPAKAKSKAKSKTKSKKR